MFAEIVVLFPVFDDDPAETERQNKIIRQMRRESSYFWAMLDWLRR